MATTIQGFGDRLTKARMDKDWLQSDLGKAIGLKNGSAISQWENGRRMPYGWQLAAICVALEVSADWLLGIGEAK